MFAFIIVAIIVLVIIIPGTEKPEKAEKTVKEETTAETVETNINELALRTGVNEDNDSTVTGFFTKYYTALSEGDSETLKSMFDQSNVGPNAGSIAELVDEYQNIRVYTADGINEGEMAAFVYNDVKFSSIDTVAPSVDSFYLKKSDGELRIMGDMYTNPDIAEYLNVLAGKEPIKGIMDNTEKWLETSLAKDDVLTEIFNKMRSEISSGTGD